MSYARGRCITGKVAAVIHIEEVDWELERKHTQNIVNPNDLYTLCHGWWKDPNAIRRNGGLKAEGYSGRTHKGTGQGRRSGTEYGSGYRAGEVQAGRYVKKGELLDALA